MIKVENIRVFNFEGAVRGMRFPLNSNDKSDSGDGCDTNLCSECGFKPVWCGNTPKYIIGENDLALIRKLYKAGSSHRKYLRQILVSMDITAPEYFYMQLDTYKVSTCSQSSSKMHTIHKRDLTLEDFSYDNMSGEGVAQLQHYIDDVINRARRGYESTKNPTFWNDVIKLLPMSFNQKRAFTMNYENVVTIIEQRSGHRLSEWHEFVEVLKDLPYIREITEE